MLEMYASFVFGFCAVICFSIGLYYAHDWEEEAKENLVDYTMLYTLVYFVMAMIVLSLSTFI